LAQTALAALNKNVARGKAVITNFRPNGLPASEWYDMAKGKP
jgi:hypothetical protein